MRLERWLRTRLARLRAIRYRTMFGTARVYETLWEGSRIRVLELDGTYQSATYLDERWCDPPFSYLQRYDLVFEAGVPVRDMCMLGGGGYAYPKHVVAHHPQARIDVVEIDPRMTQIAHDHFFLDLLRSTFRTDETGRLGIIDTDALSHLRDCAARGRRYDAILNDCFAASEPEAALVTTKAAALLHACLNPKGLYVTNVITALEGEDASPLMELVAVLGAEFEHVMALPDERTGPTEENNVMVVASDCQIDVPGAYRLMDRVAE